MQSIPEVSKVLLAFDIDHTLSDSKQPITKEMGELLARTLEKFQVCIMSGRSYEQFLTQVISNLPNPSVEQLQRLHLFPAQSTQYYCFTDRWEPVYSHGLSSEQISRIFDVVEAAARELGLWREEDRETSDKVLENRVSQVTFAGVDTEAPIEVKQAWDPDCAKREAIIARCKELAPEEFEYKLGGSTSIDITAPGMDKSYGMKHLMNRSGIPKEQILYFGDMTQEGGNDYPIVELGIDTITVDNYRDTMFALRGILGIIV